MKKYILFLFLIFTISIHAQFSILNITPADGSTNLALNNIISVEFNQPLDTTRRFEFFQNYFTNAFSQDSIWYSADLKIVNISVNLEENKNYYFLVYSANALSEEKLSNPTVVYFTTAPNFSGRTVSGFVTAIENSGLDFTKTLVALSSTPIGEGEPKIEIGTFANSAGEYSIPNVMDGDYYPIAANDANGDGTLDPSGGDAFSFLEMINISDDYSGLNFVLDIPEPLTLLNAYEIADSLSQELIIGNKYLKMIRTWNTDTLGNAGEWEFLYTTDSLNKVSKLRIDRFGFRFEDTTDEWESQGLQSMDLLPPFNTSVDLGIFMANAEAAGGKKFRRQEKPSNLEFRIEIVLADQRYSHLSYLNPDTSKHVMWAASYHWYDQVSEDNWQQESELVYFGDFETGNLIITDLDYNKLGLPNNYSLEQNYPNPFNPTTSIFYSINNREAVNITVYDLLGNKIKTLVNEVKSAGSYTISFNASNYPSGVYFYQMKTENYVSTKKMLLLK